MEAAEAALKFYRAQLRRFLWPSLAILALDFVLLFMWIDLPVRKPLIAILSGSLGGFVRFLVAEPIPVENLNDTANMFRYWASLAVGLVLGLFSYLLLMDARLFKMVYPTLSLEQGFEPSAISAAIFGGLVGLLAKEIVVAGQKRIKTGE